MSISFEKKTIAAEPCPKETESHVAQTEAERDQLKAELESEIQYLMDDKDRAQARHMVSFNSPRSNF